MNDMERRLRATTDAQVWATEFLRVVSEGATVDFGLMVGWFANAIESAKATASNRATSSVPDDDLAAIAADLYEIALVARSSLHRSAALGRYEGWVREHSASSVEQKEQV